jgi:hypothetical protein
MSPASVEQRCSERLPSGRTIRVVVRRRGIIAPPLWAVVADYSLTGIGLVCRGVLEKGDELLLLPNNDLMAPVRYLYTVVHVRQAGDCEYRVGATFTRTEPGLRKHAAAGTPAA